MRVRVKNPTRRSKAVRANGGLEVIASGKQVDLDVSWTEPLARRYEAAGLELTQLDGDADQDQGGNERSDTIRMIMQNLPQESFTQGGKPEVDAINGMLGEGVAPISAEERDAIWADVQAGNAG